MLHIQTQALVLIEKRFHIIFTDHLRMQNVLNWEVGRSTASFSISAFLNLCSFTFLGVAQIEGNFLQKNEFKAWSRRR